MSGQEFVEITAQSAPLKIINIPLTLALSNGTYPHSPEKKMAHTHSALKILEVKRVAPFPADSAAPKSLPLTFFDLLWVRMLPVQRLFFYDYPSIDTQVLLDLIVPNLKHSLSLTLYHYLPLAGNLSWPQDSGEPVLNYVEGDGVSLTIAESSSVDIFDELSGNDRFCDATKCHPLLPNLSVSNERAAAMALQVTLFPNFGFCLGITSHHAVMDGRTSTSFMKSWAHTCKTSSSWLLPDRLTPFYDRTVIKDPGEVEATFLEAWLKQAGPENRSLKLMESPVPPSSVRATFELSREDIEKLREYVSGRSSKNGPIRLSTFSVVCGYTWSCIAKSSEISKGKKTILAYNVDCRSRLKPAVPPTYFGNCVIFGMAVAKAEDLSAQEGAVSAIEAVSKAVKSWGDNDINDNIVEAAKTMASFLDSADQGSTSSSGPPEISIGIAGSNRFEVYSIDFGWGRPKKVEMVSTDRTGAISISDSKNGNGGVDIGLVLNIEKMKAFASAFAKGLEAL